jgi:hypothetical protein
MSLLTAYALICVAAVFGFVLGALLANGRSNRHQGDR